MGSFLRKVKMAMKRKRVSRKPRRVNTIRRYFRRRNRLRGAVNIGRTPILYSKEQGLGNLVVTAGSSFTGWGYAVTLDQISNYAELTELFDQYKLVGCMFKFRLIVPPEASSTGTNNQYYPDIAVTVDHDDAVAPTSYETIIQYGKSKQGILRPDRWFTYKCRPTALVMAYRTSTTTAYGPASPKQFFDCGNVNIPFYGVKAAVKTDNLGNVTNNLGVEIRFRSTWKFKNSR